jgi:hypothetical protein
MSALRQRQPRQENDKHLRFVASMGCLICGARNVQAAHVRYADLSVGKEFCGKQEKPDDKFTVPLCVEHHRTQHSWGSERDWWKLAEIDPIKTALALFAVSGDEARGEMIVSSCREQRAA